MKNTIYNSGWENNLSKRIRERRNEMGLSQPALASELNVSQQTVSGWETGKNIPEMPMLITLCNFFGCEVDSLLGRIDDYKTHDNKWICEKTGLSEKSVDFITRGAGGFIYPLNVVLSSDEAIYFVDCINSYIDAYYNPFTHLYIKHDDDTSTLVYGVRDVAYNHFGIDSRIVKQSIIYELQTSLESICKKYNPSYTLNGKPISAKAFYGDSESDYAIVTTKSFDEIVSFQEVEE